MNAHGYFAMLARYNLWATEALFAHVNRLSDDEYRRDAGLFFKSVHGTLNHLLLGSSLLWLPRFASGVSPRLKLSDEVEPDRQRVHQRLVRNAHDWAAEIAGWDASRFDGSLDYTATSGLSVSVPFTPALTHVFNHGTHHRGQVTAALTGMGRECPDIDLAVMLVVESQRAQAAAAAAGSGLAALTKPAG